MYTKEYFTWKGIHHEMIILKKAYGERGVPRDIWNELEAMCKEAATAMHAARRREPTDA